jgi:MFS transporter, ACS family, aldohexuronate transporter
LNEEDRGGAKAKVFNFESASSSARSFTLVHPHARTEQQICHLANRSYESTNRVSARTWWICIFLLLATVLNYLDRQVLALTADKIITEFGLTKEGLGSVIAAFRYAYGILQVLGGFLVDSYGPGLVYPAAGGLWSLAGILTGAATTVGMLIGFRFMLGVGEAFNWPCALKATQTLLPSKDRPLANGIFNSGAAVGALLAPVIVTPLVIYYGWRAAFVVTGALGGLWVVGWLWYTRKEAKELEGVHLELGTALLLMVRILRMRRFWLLAVSAIIINSVSYFLADWIPLYLKTSRGFSFAAGNLLSIVVYAGLSGGNILVGLVVRKLVNSGLTISAAKKRSLFASCVLMCSAALAGITPYRYVAVGCLTLTGVGVAGFLVIYLTLVQDLDPAYVGISSGLLGGLGNLAYGYFSPLIGRLADLHKTNLTLTFIGLFPWLAFIAIFPVLKNQPE